MNAKTALALATLFGSITCAIVIGSPAQAENEFDGSASVGTQLAVFNCASGYHLNAAGDCEPKYHRPSRCRKGYEAESFPNGNGYKCVRIPAGY